MNNNLNLPDYYKEFINLLRIKTYDVIYNAKHLKFAEQDYIFFDPTELKIELYSIFPIKSFPIVPNTKKYKLNFDKENDKHQLVNLDDEEIQSFNTFEELKEKIVKIIHQKFRELKIDESLGDLSKTTEEDIIKGQQWWKRMELNQYFNFRNFLREIIFIDFGEIIKISFFTIINFFMIYFVLFDCLIFEIFRLHPMWTIVGSTVYFLINFYIILKWIENLGGKFKFFE